MTAVLYVLVVAVLGSLWRRWLGEADTGPRAVKVATGFALVAALLLAWRVPDDLAPRLAFGLALGAAMLPHVMGFGRDGWNAPINLLFRWLPASALGVAAVLVGHLGWTWWCLMFPVAVVGAGASWIVLEMAAGRTHRLTAPVIVAGREWLGGFTTYAELAAGALVWGAVAFSWSRA